MLVLFVISAVFLVMKKKKQGGMKKMDPEIELDVKKNAGEEKGKVAGAKAAAEVQ